MKTELKTELFTPAEQEILHKALLGDDADHRTFLRWCNNVRENPSHPNAPALDLLLSGWASATVIEVRPKQKNKYPPYHKIAVRVRFGLNMAHPQRWQEVCA